ncbi:hypothetical protein ONZ45_g7245 [Pleurotus djamor]|nr:hypothetical protein ONZ45_g7245 [Pleurotus djamor]
MRISSTEASGSGSQRQRRNAKEQVYGSITRSAHKRQNSGSSTKDSPPKKRTHILHEAFSLPNGRVHIERTCQTTTTVEDLGVEQQEAASNEPADSSSASTLDAFQPESDRLAATQAVEEGREVEEEEDTEDLISPPLQQWADTFRDTFIDEFLRLEGRGGFSSCSTPHAEEEEGLYRCQDCSTSHLYCLDCILVRHRELPLHRIQIWEEGHFAKKSLSSLGLIVQLGHGGGECPLPSETRKDFCVVDTSGHHLINLRFCDCDCVEEYVQLLRARWYPASTSRPRTAFTFDCLNTFHLLTLQGKLSAYDYCLSLERKTDNADLHEVMPRYDQFLPVIRQYRHLRAIKRSGMGHEPEGVAATPPGALAVDCPACPHPSINLPLNWKTLPASIRWIYNLRLTIDANFRLKNRDRNLGRDKPLGDGWGHWVPNEPYMEYVAAHGKEVEPNLCDSELRAVDHANSKSATGYAATGVVAVLCARHGLVRRNGLGSLQKGERYANSDFVVHFTLKDQEFSHLVISYDIACQYSRNFATRNRDFPSDLRLRRGAINAISYVVPKFHLYAHGQACQAKFNLNYILWSAETDGEDPERWWSHINPVSMSTKIMGPGSRVDTIDDHATAWNWRKIVHMDRSLLERLQTAVKMKARHVALHAEYTETFAAERVATWRQALSAWERDSTKPNPFVDKDGVSTMAAIRLELANEDSHALEAAPDGDNEFLYKGLELEESQRILRFHKDKTVLQAAELQEKRNTLCRQIMAWREEQREHMPSIGVSDRSIPSTNPELIPLRLPSSVPPSSLLKSLRKKEKRLRLAQVHDSLLELRRLLRITAGLSHFKNTQVGYGQSAKTRAQTQINRFKSKVNLVANRYRDARSALSTLDPQGTWTTKFLPLGQDDCRWPSRDPDSVENNRESRREVSWIWRSITHINTANSDVTPTAAQQGEIGEALRLEWTKSQARVNRWTEELTLTTEEMRRTAVYLEAKATSWYSRMARSRKGSSSEIEEGLGAYGYRQAALYRALKAKFVASWKPTLAGNNIDVDFEAM